MTAKLPEHQDEFHAWTQTICSRQFLGTSNELLETSDIVQQHTCRKDLEREQKPLGHNIGCTQQESDF